MSPEQLQRFYLPTWQRAFAANWQRGGRRGCTPREDRQLTPYVTMVEEAALVLAREAGRRLPNEEQIRHAATWVATTRFANYSPRAHATTSSKRLNNGQTQVLVALLDLLIDPDNLAALTRWMHPHLGEQAGIEAVIHEFPRAYIDAITKDQWDTNNWWDLSLANKRNLLRTLKNRLGKSGAEPARATEVPPMRMPQSSECGPG
jgi:hypothetical protein